MRLPAFFAWTLSFVFALSLAGCGGGDDSSGNATATVPTSATSSLGSDEAAAKSVVALMVSSDDQAVQSDDSFDQINGLTSTVGLTTGSFNPARAAKQIQETVSCSAYYPIGQAIGNAQVSGCSGMISVVSNLDEFQNSGSSEEFLPAGAYFTVSFGQVTVQTSDGGSFSLGGSMTLTVLASSGQQGFGNSGFVGSFRITVNNLTGVDESGESFGPENGTIEVTFDSNGGTSYVIDGVRVSDFNVTETTDDDSYTINSGSIITDYEGGHAEVAFQNWVVVDGIPQVGSSVTVTGSNGSATATVLSVDGTTITIQVVINADGGSQAHMVNGTISGTEITVN